MSKSNGKPVYDAADASEAALLACLLTDPAGVPEAIGSLTGSDFRHAHHGHIFRAIAEVHALSGTTSVGLVLAHLQQAGELHERTEDYVKELRSQVATGGELLYHLAQVKDASRVRAMLRFCDSFRGAALGREDSPDGLLERFREHADALGKESARKEVTGRVEDIATLADLLAHAASIDWIWPSWIQRNVVTVLAAEGGTGKTRFVADVLRRVRHGLPWPDDSPMTVPYTPGGCLALVVASDNHHDELCSIVEEFGVEPECVRLNAHKSDPFGGTLLESKEDLDALESRARTLRPLFVVVDTVGSATELNLSKQEDAKKFYTPLQVIARRAGCSALALTHTNASGKVLGRRASEKARVVIRMVKPEGEDRRRLEVVKSNSKQPPPLGVTMKTGGNDYDDNPPALSNPNARDEPGAQASPKLQEAKDWLTDRLKTGPARVSHLRNDAKENGISTNRLYAAMRNMSVEEYDGADRKKWWRLPPREEGEEDPPDPFD
jgi:hypothetical protein